MKYWHIAEEEEDCSSQEELLISNDELLISEEELLRELLKVMEEDIGIGFTLELSKLLERGV